MKFIPKNTMNKLWLAFITLSLCSCSDNSTPITKPAEKITATHDQAIRREKSERYCRSHNIPIYENPNALFIDPEEKVVIRSREDVIDRALALCYMGLKGEGLDRKYLDKMDHDYDISSKLSPAEKEYVAAIHPSEQQNTDATWRYESLHVMLWALGYIDTLAYPEKMCDAAQDVKIINDLTAQQFRQKAKLRSKQEIMDMADLILRLDWACVSATVKKTPVPGNLNSGVVVEWHHSLNWLINYSNQDWDDVTTDT